MFKDGFCLFYIKDGELYPVVLSKEQNDAFESFLAAIPGKMNIVINKPHGKH